MHGHPLGQSAAHARVPTTGSTGSSRRRAIPASLLALALLAGASACSSDANADPPDTTKAAPASTTTTAAPTTTTTEPKSEEDEVAEAYLEAKAVFFEIGLQPDPDDPRLADHFGEPNLGLIRSGFARLREDDVRAKYPNGKPPVPDVLAVTVDGETAQVEACVVDDAQQVLHEGGNVVNDAVVSKKYDVVMAELSGTWKVVDGPLTEKWPDGEGCDR